MLAVVDYGVGNLFSVEKALTHLGAEVVLTREEEEIRAAERIVLPGVGAFGDCMNRLMETGLLPVLKEEAEKGKPFLGICVGLQLLFEGSEESPEARGLGFFRGTVRKIRAEGMKIPQIGWNHLEFSKEKHPLFQGLEKPYVYFVHSYHAVPEEEEKDIVVAETIYGERLTAAIARKNIIATQFHPEKSGDVGLKILENFISMPAMI